jgi:hypothetical protein
VRQSTCHSRQSGSAEVILKAAEGLAGSAVTLARSAGHSFVMSGYLQIINDLLVRKAGTLAD